MYLFRCVILALCCAMSGCAAFHESMPPKFPVKNGFSSVSPSLALPGGDILPEQSAMAPGTRYVFIQSEGGSVLLGPVLGSMNITAQTKAIAEKYKDSLPRIDPFPIAISAMEKAGIQDAKDAASFKVRPFIFIQHCYDEKFRLSLVLHVDGAGENAGWVGRYTYHMPTSYAAAEFGSLTPDQIAHYKAELADGAAALADLMQRDLTGKLPATGKRVNFGSLYIIGNKMGGMGIYTMPELRYFPNAQLIEETDRYVTVRLIGDMHGTAIMGGMSFGIHRIDKKLVHTLQPVSTP